MSKYLVWHLKKRQKASETRVTGLQVLTSAEGIAILKEKEEKKTERKMKKRGSRKKSRRRN